jgi:hypothetical protein
MHDGRQSLKVIALHHSLVSHTNLFISGRRHLFFGKLPKHPFVRARAFDTFGNVGTFEIRERWTTSLMPTATAENDALQAVRMEFANSVRNDRSHRIPKEMCLGKSQMVKETHDIVRHLGAVLIWLVWFIALAVPTTIDPEYPVPTFHELVDNPGAFHPTYVHRVTVEYDDRFTGALIRVMDLHATGLEEAALSRGRRLTEGDDAPR